MRCASRNLQSGGVVLVHGAADCEGWFRSSTHAPVVIQQRPGDLLSQVLLNTRGVAAAGFNVVTALRPSVLPHDVTARHNSLLVFEPLAACKCAHDTARALQTHYHLLTGSPECTTGAIGYLTLGEVQAAYHRARGHEVPPYNSLLALLGLDRAAGVFLQPKHTYSAVLPHSADVHQKAATVERLLLKATTGAVVPALGGSSYLFQWLWDILPSWNKKTSDPKILVINLDRRTDRLTLIRRQLEEQGLSFERIRAVDGREKPHIPEAEVTRTWDTTLNSKYDRLQFRGNGEVLRMSASERACAKSHMLAWKEIYDQGMPYATVFEDDALLDTDFKERLPQLLGQVPSDWDILYLGYYLPNMGGNDPSESFLTQFNQIPSAPDLFQPNYLWWLIGYVMSASGARKALNNLPIHSPVDNFLAELVLTKKLNAWAVKHPIVHMPPAKRSDIHHTVSKGKYHGADAPPEPEGDDGTTA